MKYMGSKRYMLQNGLGHMLLEESHSAKRVFDLFCGTGSVAAFCAERIDVPVTATDLQDYAVVLTRSIIGRTCAVSTQSLRSEWIDKVDRCRKDDPNWKAAGKVANVTGSIVKLVNDARKLCSKSEGTGPICNAYGGYYFSPQQAITLDHMLQLCPQAEPERSVCLACTIAAASKCAASPGHTAQPFRPTDTAGKFILEAWGKDPLQAASSVLADTGRRHAKRAGSAYTADALDVAANLTCDDLAFVDPPYSGVQYSRFYHVLETIAKGRCSAVAGAGRYPPIEERPQSSFCNKSQSLAALQDLIEKLARSGCRVIFTFPAGQCSNGLSGDDVKRVATTRFSIREDRIVGRFSTLGGNNGNRAARHASCELLLLMSPK